MLEPFFFALGIVNSIALTVIFLVRKRRLDLIRKLGWLYLLHAIPAVCGISLAAREGKESAYSIFLGIFLVFLMIEGLFDHVFRIEFRENWKKYWMLMVPYLAVYYAMNYGFIVMPWKTSTAWGIMMLVLFIVQIITNLISHARMKSQT